MGDVTPKLPSTVSLFQTLLELPLAGKAPVLVAGPPVPAPVHVAVVGQSGGSVVPTVRVLAVPWYTLRDTTRLLGVKPENWANKVWVNKAAAARAPQANLASFL